MDRPLGGLISELRERLEGVGIDQSLAEVELILCHVLQCDRITLYLDGIKLLTPEKLKQVEDIVEKRLTRHPLQFILGEAWFHGRRFFVNEHVMAPTPETELLCEQALAFIEARDLDSPRIVDVGIGSGVVSVTLGCELKNASIVGLDISEEAIEVAERNIELYSLSERIEVRQSDFFAAVQPGEEFDLILSNPPYIAEPDYGGLDPEVKADPKIAMTSGEDGLDAIRMFIREAPNFLAPGGRIAFEIGRRRQPLQRYHHSTRSQRA